jgi:hypothetical protein
LVVCFGVAGVHWRSLHILSDDRKTELLNHCSPLVGSYSSLCAPTLDGRHR